MPTNIAIIIPAAGASTRLGTPKQLVDFDGETLIRRAARTALDVSPDVVVVTGCEDVLVRQEIQDLPVFVADNPDWEKGMGTSIACGVRAAIDRFPAIDGVVIHLCDMPLIDSTHLNGLVEHSDGTEAVYTVFDDAEGVPACFGRSLFEELLFLDGDRGAKDVIKNAVEKKAVAFKGRYVDIDLPEDLGQPAGE